MSLTRLDIAYSMSIISQFMHAPTQQHMAAVYHILKYLRGTLGKGLFFQKNNERGAGYSDADWAALMVDSWSTSGFCTKFWGNLVTWRSKSNM